jgi:hypothetical protein
MPHAHERSKQKRDACLATIRCFPQNGMVLYGEISPRHCERSEAIQNPTAARLWIASLRSQ